MYILYHIEVYIRIHGIFIYIYILRVYDIHNINQYHTSDITQYHTILEAKSPLTNWDEHQITSKILQLG